MSFEILDTLSMADTAFRASGLTRSELFVASAEALLSILLLDPASVRKKNRKDFSVEADDIELLLYRYLQEFVFLKDSEFLLLVPVNVDIRGNGGGWVCRCSAMGETIDAGRHLFHADIKSVTMHNLKVWEEDGIWMAQVVIDV